MPTRKRNPRRRKVQPAAGRPAMFTVERLDQLKALTHPVRQQLLEEFAAEPRTTKQAATRLGHKATRLYHHVAALEKAGLIELVATRPVRGTTEKYYSTIARNVRIDPSLLAAESSWTAIHAAGLDVVEAVLGNVRRDIADLLRSEDRDSGREEDEVMFVQVDVGTDPDVVRRFRGRIDELLAELDAEGCGAGKDSSGGGHRMVIGWYPRAPKTQSSDER